MDRPMHWQLRSWVGDGLDMANLSYVKGDPDSSHYISYLLTNGRPAYHRNLILRHRNRFTIGIAGPEKVIGHQTDLPC